MNKLFAKTIEYGNLFYDEIFLYYDGPCIFSITNTLGHRFICLLETEADKYNRYIVAPVSFARYREFVSNMIPIRYVFTKSEAGGVFTISNSNEEISQVVRLYNSEIEIMNLPKESEYLDIKESYTSSELVYNSVENRRGIAQYSFEKDGGHKQSIKANELSVVTKRLQKVMDGIEKDWAKNEGQRESKNRRKEMKEASQLTITRTFAASFGLQVESDMSRDLFFESAFDTLMQKFVKLINFRIDEEDEQFYRDNNSALPFIRDYFKALMVNNFAMRFQTATPDNRIAKLNLSMNEIKERYNFLSSIIDGGVVQIEMVGHLLAFDIKLRTFKFRMEEGIEINGKLDIDFDETVFDTGNLIKVLVDKKTEVIITGDGTDKYTLLKIISEDD